MTISSRWWILLLIMFSNIGHSAAQPAREVDRNAGISSLRKESSVPVEIRFWPNTGTVSHLTAQIPSRLPRTASADQHARAFVSTHKELWGVDPTQLRVAAVGTSGPCTAVTLQQIEPRTKLPIFNALLTVRVGNDGSIRGADGRFAAISEAEALVPDSTMTVDEAKQLLAAELQRRKQFANAPLARSLSSASSLETIDAAKLPDPTEVVLSPTFSGGGNRKPIRAWLFSAPPGDERTQHHRSPARPLFAIDEESGQIQVDAVGMPPPMGDPCAPGDPTLAVPRVVLDPLTETPALVDLLPMGGIPTVGADPIDRAYSLLETDLVKSIYGDLIPRKHLRDGRIIGGNAGRSYVHFVQYFASVPIEGSEMIVTLAADGTAESLFSRVIYFPNVFPKAGLPSDIAELMAAAKNAELECETRALKRGSDPAYCVDNSDLPREDPLTTSLSIVSRKIFENVDIPAGHDHELAWRVEFSERVIFWSANYPSQYIFGWRKTASDVSWTIHNSRMNNRAEITNGVAAHGIVPSPDVLSAGTSLTFILTFYNALGFAPNLPLDVFVDDDSFGSGDAESNKARIRLGSRRVDGEVLAHEFTHFVAFNTTPFAITGETGALQESYADVMANLAFPDSTPGNWLIGENSKAGAVRDMKSPEHFGHPSHMSMKSNNCPDDMMPGQECVHNWAGIPNRAAVLIAEGVPESATLPLGRDKLRELYFDTLTQLLGPSDHFVQQRLKTIATCETLVRDKPGTWNDRDCDHVAVSFGAVGVEERDLSGWFQFADLKLASVDVTFHSGEHLHRGCTLRDQILVLTDQNGHTATSHWASGMSAAVDPEWGARVTRRGSLTDLTDRSVTVNIWSAWAALGVVNVTELRNLGPGVTSSIECDSEPNSHPRTLFSTARVTHFPVFLNGERFDDVVNFGIKMPAGCVVETMWGVDYHHTGTITGFPSLNESFHGFTITGLTSNLGHLDANVHTWHDAFSAIRVRVQYNIQEPNGVDCAVPGKTQDSP